jgi:hypothetical protein
VTGPPGKFLPDYAADGAGAEPLAARRAGVRAASGLAADCAAACTGYGHWPGRRAARDCDVRAAVAGVLVAVVSRGAIPNDHELDCLVGG